MRGVIFLLATVGFGAAAAQEKAMTIRPAGVTLVWQQIDNEAFQHIAVLNSQEPVALALYLSGGEKKIVSIDRDKSKLTEFADDHETVIVGTIGYFPRIAEDGSSAIVEIRGENPVSPKAQVLLAKGEFKLALASKTDAKRSKVVEIKKGAKVEVADNLVFEISQSGKPDWGDDPFAVSLTIKRDIPEVAKVRFFDGEGKQIAANLGSSSRSGGFLGIVTVTRSYNLKRKADRISLEVDRWTDLEEVVVPFDVKVGIGGGK